MIFLGGLERLWGRRRGFFRKIAIVIAFGLIACGGSGGGDGGSGGGGDNPSGGETPVNGDPLLPTPGVCSASSDDAAAVTTPVLRSTLDGSWDENWLASPAVADIDGDGDMEIVAARHSVLYVYHHDGSLNWQTAFGYSASNSPEHGATRMWASPVVGDMDGDGRMEIAVGGDSDSTGSINICVYDHQGELRAGWPRQFGNTEVRSIAAADVDGDGILEILVNKTGSGPTTAVYELNGSLHANWPQVSASCDPPDPAEPCWDFGGYNQNIGAGDLDGDGVMDVISTYDAIGFGVFWGDGRPFPTAADFSDPVITAVEAYHDIELSQQGWGTGDRSEFTYSPPVVADVDADGQMNIVLAGDHEHTQSTTNQGVTVWVLNADLTRPAGWAWPKDTGAPVGGSNLGSNIVHTMPGPSVADLDGNPGLEILVPAYDGKLYAFRSDGSVYWTHSFATVASPYTGASEATIADLNQDGVPEIIYTTYSSGEPRDPDTPAHLVILASNGVQQQRVELFGRGSMAAPTVADVDGDGDVEIVVSLKDSLGSGKGGVQIWDVAESGTNCMLWPTGRGSYLREGNYVNP